jgi:drug/metabolite transporter (DMT)-like permease
MPLPGRNSRAAAMLVFTTLAWGAMFAVAKTALGTLDAFWLSALRYVPAALVMLAVLGVVEGRAALAPKGAGWRLLGYGTLGFAGFSILGFLGLSQSRPEHAAIIVALMPLVTAVLTWVLRGQRPAPVTVASLLVALLGVAMVVTRGDVRLALHGTLHADALVLAGVVCWVAYTMGATTLTGVSTPGRLQARTSPEARSAEGSPMSTLRYTALSMAGGSIAIVVAALVASAVHVANPPAWHTVASLPLEIAYLSLVSGVLAVLAWNGGVAVLGPANGVLFINLVPITALAVGIAQGHRFGRTELVGAALVIGALVVNNLATRAATPPALASRPKFA